MNHFELVIPERLVPVEGIDGDIHLPNPLVAVDEFMRAAAAMRVEIKDDHGAGACVERRTGRDLPQVAASMLVFGIGATLPLLIIGLLSREALQRWRKQALSVSHAVKAALGVLLILIGALVLAGFDKRVETVLVNASPQWLTDLTTRF